MNSTLGEWYINSGGSPGTKTEVQGSLLFRHLFTPHAVFTAPKYV